jgi:hypothetical protein
MTTHGTTHTMDDRVKTRGEVFEGIAFQFCKIATVAIIAGRYVLPVAAGLCSVFYILTYVSGKKDTRCYLRMPLLIAGLYGLVAIASTWFMVHPIAFRL